MRKQRIFYKCLGLLIYSTLLVLFFACGKPTEEKKKSLTDGIITEMDEELEAMTNASPKIEKRLPSKTKILSIRIYPKNVLNPVEEIDRVNLTNCGRGDWDKNEVYYDKTKVSWKNYTQRFPELAKNDLHFKATSPRGTYINASLDVLLKNKSASISLNGKYVEIKLPSKEWTTAINGKDELDIELVIIPSKTTINVGNMREIRRVCVRTPRDPPRGAEGGRAGGWHKDLDRNFIEGANFEGFGYSTQVFEVQYELDIRFISHY